MVVAEKQGTKKCEENREGGKPPSPFVLEIGFVEFTSTQFVIILAIWRQYLLTPPLGRDLHGLPYALGLYVYKLTLLTFLTLFCGHSLSKHFLNKRSDDEKNSAA